MRNFSIMPLEERIVLDATLLSQLITFNIHSGDSVNLSGPDLSAGLPAYRLSTPTQLTSGPSNPGHFVDASTGLQIGTIPSANQESFSAPYIYDLLTHGMSAVQFTQIGTHQIQFDFADKSFANLTVAIVNVSAPMTTPTISESPTAVSMVEGATKAVQTIGSFSISDPTITDPSLFSISNLVSSNQNDFFTFGDPSIAYDGSSGLFNVTAIVAPIDAISNGTFTMDIAYAGDPGHNPASASIHSDVVIADAPLTNPAAGSAIVGAVEGTTLSHQLLATFRDGNFLATSADYQVTFSGLASVDVQNATFVMGTKTISLYGDVVIKDVVNGNLTININDVDGSVLPPIDLAISSSDAPLTGGSDQSLSLVEGSNNFLVHQLVATFTDANPYALATDFSVAVNGLQNGDAASNISVEKASGNDFNIYANLSVQAGNNAGLSPNSASVIINDIDGASTSTVLSFDITPAPWNLGPGVSISPLLGTPFVGKIGSFVDSNPNEALTNYQVIVDSDPAAAGNQGSGYLVQTGVGAYDVYGQLTYNSAGSLPGTFEIRDTTNFGAAAPSETLFGSFTANVRANQLLWGVDQSNGQLFSIGDYSIPGAESRVSLYGQLHTAAGVIIGNDIRAFTLDAADANGHNAAYVAISKSVDGINTFSIGVIADINDPAHRSEVTLYKISGLNFNLAKDNITGLAIDPNSGNLLGVVVRDNSPATLFVIDKNTLSSADHIAKAYTLGKIIGTDDLGGQKVTNARDLAFDSSGNLFVTDGAKDKLYQISSANGEILAVSNMNEDNGLGEANIEALAWDPVLGKLIGANSILNAGLPANDLVGLSTANGPNAIDVHLLQSLNDIEGMAFMPKFGLRSGDNLGVLIDTGQTEVDYQAGQGPVLLLHNVELISFGENTYDNGSLTVDVSGVDLGEFFAIKAGNGITIDAAGNVRYKGLFFGTIDALENGKNGNALTIHFNANAGEKAVEHLMERITYLNTDSALTLVDKVIAFTIRDALGNVIGYTTINLDVESSLSSC